LQVELKLDPTEIAVESSAAIEAGIMKPAPAPCPTPAEPLETPVTPIDSHNMTEARVSASSEQDEEARYTAKAAAAAESREDDSSPEAHDLREARIPASRARPAELEQNEERVAWAPAVKYPVTLRLSKTEAPTEM
jgi:hypothetical protein